MIVTHVRLVIFQQMVDLVNHVIHHAKLDITLQHNAVQQLMLHAHHVLMEPFQLMEILVIHAKNVQQVRLKFHHALVIVIEFVLLIVETN